MTSECCKEIGICNYFILVYGDDHVVIFYNEGDGKKFHRNFLNFTNEKFGVNGNLDEYKLIKPENYYVTYEMPIYPPGEYLSKGTRNLKPIRIEKSRVSFKEYDHSKGTTHR